MPKPREELRRGLRDLIERTSREMEALGDLSSGGTASDEAPHGAASRGAAPDAVIAERPQAPDAPTPDPSSRPMLRLVRKTVRSLIGTREAPTVETTPSDAVPQAGAASPAAPATAPTPTSRPEPMLVPQPLDVEVLHAGVHPRRGVCESYYINHACWEVSDAFCNHALHTCMLRDCPVYRLHREELEKRFASKYSHLW